MSCKATSFYVNGIKFRGGELTTADGRVVVTGKAGPGEVNYQDLDSGTVLHLTGDPSGLSLVFDRAAASGRRGRSSFNPEAYDPAQRAQYVELAVAGLAAESAQMSSSQREYARKVLLAALEYGTDTLVNRKELASLVYADDVVAAVGAVGAVELVHRLAGTAASQRSFRHPNLAEGQLRLLADLAMNPAVATELPVAAQARVGYQLGVALYRWYSTTPHEPDFLQGHLGNTIDFEDTLLSFARSPYVHPVAIQACSKALRQDSYGTYRARWRRDLAQELDGYQEVAAVLGANPSPEDCLNFLDTMQPDGLQSNILNAFSGRFGDDLDPQVLTKLAVTCCRLGVNPEYALPDAARSRQGAAVLFQLLATDNQVTRAWPIAELVASGDRKLGRTASLVSQSNSELAWPAADPLRSTESEEEKEQRSAKTLARALQYLPRGRGLDAAAEAVLGLAHRHPQFASSPSLRAAVATSQFRVAVGASDAATDSLSRAGTTVTHLGSTELRAGQDNLLPRGAFLNLPDRSPTTFCAAASAALHSTLADTAGQISAEESAQIDARVSAVASSGAAAHELRALTRMQEVEEPATALMFTAEWLLSGTYPTQGQALADYELADLAAAAFTVQLIDPRPTGDNSWLDDAQAAGREVYGYEVTTAHAAQLTRNTDPQHGGDSEGRDAGAAITAALTEPPPPLGATVATVRPDPDAFGAMAVAALRASGVDLSTPEYAVLRERASTIAEADASSSAPWQPRDPAAPDPALSDTAVLAAMIGDFRTPPQERLARTTEWLLTGGYEGMSEQAATLTADRAAARADIAGRGGVTVTAAASGVPVARLETTHRMATSIGYEAAPVVVATNPSMPGPDGAPYVKHTVARWNSDAAKVDFAGLRVALDELEASRGGTGGWGGTADLLGSPQGVSSQVDADELAELVARFTA